MGSTEINDEEHPLGSGNTVIKLEPDKLNVSGHKAAYVRVCIKWMGAELDVRKVPPQDRTSTYA